MAGVILPGYDIGEKGVDCPGTRVHERYDLEYRKNGSDKIYIIVVTENVLEGLFFTTTFYGRRGNKCQNQEKYNGPSQSNAKSIAHQLLREKTGKGYIEVYSSNTSASISQPPNSMIITNDTIDMNQYPNFTGSATMGEYDLSRPVMSTDLLTTYIANNDIVVEEYFPISLPGYLFVSGQSVQTGLWNSHELVMKPENNSYFSSLQVHAKGEFVLFGFFVHPHHKSINSLQLAFFKDHIAMRFIATDIIWESDLLQSGSHFFDTPWKDRRRILRSIFANIRSQGFHFSNDDFTKGNSPILMGRYAYFNKGAFISDILGNEGNVAFRTVNGMRADKQTIRVINKIK